VARRLTLPLLLLLLALAVPATAAADDPLRPAGADTPLGDERLSNETTLTRWAHTSLLRSIRAAPAADAERVGRLRWNTEDGPPEVYLVLRSQLDANGDAWLKIRIPGRPNGRTGWVPEDGLGELREVRTHLVVDRGNRRATLYRRGAKVWTSPVGVGAPGTPTPAGRFWVRDRLANLNGDPLYGPWAFGTSAYSDRLTDWPGGGVIGIHGTNAPWLIPGRPSHGCVRVPNPAIRRLARLMPVGTPVTIR
jgi:hypothetical protein